MSNPDDYKQLLDLRCVISDLKNEIAELRAATQWVPCSERLPTIEEYPDDTEIRGTWKSATGIMKSTEMLARHIREFPSHYLAWQPLPTPYTEVKE